MANENNTCIRTLVDYDVNAPQFVEIFQNIMDQEKKKICRSIRDMAQANVFKKVVNYLNKLCTTKDAKAYSSFGAVIELIMSACIFLVENCSDVLNDDDLDNLMSALKKSIKGAREKRHVGNNVLFQFVELEKVYRETTATKRKKSAPKKKNPAPSKLLEDFRNIALLPTCKEVNQSGFSEINPILIKGAYESVERYLNDQFQLVREDYVGTIRIGLKVYRESLAHGDSKLQQRYDKIRVYKNVRFERMNYSRVGTIAYMVNFDSSNRVMTNYENSRTFMHGSLLLFSRNEFRDFFCAQIIYPNVNSLNSGKLMVTVEPNGNFSEDFLFHRDAKFTMIESDIFWEPYSCILQILKNFSEKCFPMREYIVQTSSMVQPPKYLHKFREWDVFGHSTTALDPDTWPEANKIGLDTHQYNALKNALTKKFCIIQGPPGTGKTFLGLKIVQILLANMTEYERLIRNPILIVCYTNYALDQFLEGILEFDTRIIRVGNQSRSELLDQYNFKEKKALKRTGMKEVSTEDMDAEALTTLYAERRVKQMIGKGRRETSFILQLIDKLNENLQILAKPKGITSYKYLEGVIGKQYKDVVNSDFSLIMWLLDEKETTIPELEDFNFLEQLDSRIVIDQRALEKEIFGNLFKTQEQEDADEDDTDSEKEEDMTYCISLDGLVKVCVHYKRELESITDQDCAEYMWNERHLISLVQRYFILKDNLDKTLVDEMLLQKTLQRDPLKLPLDHRWNTYFHWVEAKKKTIKGKIGQLKKEFHTSAKEMEKYIQEEDVSILQTAGVVGMTTSSAARYNAVLRKLKPSVVIVEEAAEVLEAHIIASLNEFTEHLILIGDHKQLRPSTGVYELSKNYNLDCSLFERMINNNLNCSTLQVQHRMRPEISCLLRPSIYKRLQDHESVQAYESIRGIQKNVFFIDHTQPERFSVEDPTSYTNPHEADFALELCLYLINQGYDPECISILTTYAAQNVFIKQVKGEKLAKIRSYVVDDYQGKENEIIILSLVRSNVEGDIGFLKVENRVCVALSRAKKGFYLIGNMSILSRSSSLWQKIRDTLQQNRGIGTALMLRCSKHGTRTEVATVEDFQAVKGGGCNEVCGDVLPCTHVCVDSCHIIDLDHVNEFACKKIETRTLMCGHTASVFCSEKNYLCKKEVEFKSMKCRHTLKRECFNLNFSDIVCNNFCEEVLPCKHKCPRLCHPDDDHTKFECQEDCERRNPNCPNNHPCQKKCGEPCGECLEPQTYELECGHAIELPCSTDLSSIKCSEKCGKPCSNCSLPCQKLCWEDCNPCTTEVDKIITECGHYVSVPCSVSPTPEMCTTLKNVHRKSICGHDMVYGVPCGISKTDFKVEDYLSKCEVPCNTQMSDCDHRCSGTCGRCMQGRLHVGCGKRCNKDLICGHKCPYACGEICPPCSNYSLLGCSHTNERRKCGALYINICSKRCSWECKHGACTSTCDGMCNREPCYQPCSNLWEECGHPCIGFCGEPCPTVCRLCDRDENISEHARYVMLEDCGCIFESHDIENELDHQAQFVKMLRCPQCNQLILNTMRFMNRVKIMYKRIVTLMRQTYGLGQKLTELRNQIEGKLEEFCELDEKALPGIQRMQEYVQWIVHSKHHVINERDMVIIRYFIDIFIMLGRRMSALGHELIESADYQKGVQLVSQVLNRIDLKVLLYNMHAIDGLRGEAIRMHRVLDYCILSRETPVERVEKNARLRAIREEMASKIYQPVCFESTTDARLDELFVEFLRIQPNDGLYSFDDQNLESTKWSNFLDEVSLNDWYICKNCYHCYRSLDRKNTCPEC